MSTEMAKAIGDGARALAHADGVDYFERGNLAGIADYELVAQCVLEAAADSKPGMALHTLRDRPGAVEAAARALARAEGSTAFRQADSDEAQEYRRTVRTILAGAFPVARPQAA